MALSMCVADTTTIIAKALVFLVVHWGWTLSIILIALLLRKIPFVLGVLAAFLDLIADVFLPAGAATAVTGIGLLFAAGAILFYVMIGLLFVLMNLTSKANIIVRILSVPGVFVFGVVVGAVPFISLPISIGYDAFIKQVSSKMWVNVICFIPSALLILALILFNSWYCTIITTIVTALA
ncbi:MAG: hypothetical protein ABIJ18_00080 [archaeon]